MDLFQQVREKLDQRNAKGWEQHHRALDDDRVVLNWLVELQEELLDAVLYIQGEINKRERGAEKTGVADATGWPYDSDRAEVR